MAEPLKKDPYDKKFGEEDAEPVTKPDLKSIEGGGQTTERGKGHLKSVKEPEELKQAEEEGGGKEENQTDSAESSEASKVQDTADQIGEGYRHDDSTRLSRFGSRFKGISRRKKIIGGGIIGTIITGALLFGVGQGPFQSVHLAQILGKGLLPNASTSDTRLPHIYKFMGIRDAAEAKLSFAGRRFYRHTVNKLAARGINIKVSGLGNAKVEIDIAKAFPDLVDLPHPQRVIEIARSFDIDPKKLPPRAIGTDTGTLVFEFNDLTGKEFNNFAKNGIKSLGEGRVASSLSIRTVKRAWGVPGILHPFRYLERVVDKNVANLFEAYKKKHEETRKKLKPKQTAEAADAKAEIEKENSNLTKVLSAVSLGLDIACTLYNIAEAVPVVNWGHIVVPSMVEALHTTGAGNQAMSGKDFDLGQIGAKTAALTDEKGRSVWDAKALNALANNSAGKGQDLDNGYRQAFSPRTTGELIESYVGGFIGKAAGVSVDIACSTPAQFANIIGGLALTAFTGGGWTAGKVVSAGAKAALISSLVARFTSEAIDHLSEDPIKAFSGPVGGNLMAYGIRAANNSVARMSGGVELSEDEEQVVWDKINNQEREEFKQRSFFARLFDPKDYRSLASSAMRSTPQGFDGIKSSIASFLTNPLKGLASVFSALTPRAEAATPYDYGFPLYGMPSNVINDPQFEDPFDNAEKAAQLFKTGQYIDKASKCFGVKITNTPEGWDSIPQDDPNPAESSYADAGCDDLSDDDWKRVMLFVYDSQLMASVDCYEGIDETQCNKLGFGSLKTSGSAPTEAPIKGLTSPPNLGPEIGKGYYMMPEPANGEYIFSPNTPPADRCGHKALVDTIYTVSKRWGAKYPNSKIRVGDLNAGAGHLSHKNGVDVDITTADQSAADMRGDAEKSKELGHMFADTGIIKTILYNDPAVQDDFNAYTKQNGLPGVMQYYDGHEDHFHVRISDEYRLETSLGCPA